MRALHWTTAAALVATLGGAPGCGGNEEQVRRDEDARSRAMEGATRPEDDQGRCDTDDPRHEVSEYDTSGDDYPDVRRVFTRVGEPPTVRLILTCREVDLNADGIKDVVRYYNEEGRPLREEADRDFDGTMDTITFFQDGRIVREEQDADGDGRVDTKIFYEGGEMVRTERDLAGRSTANRWSPDRWEYFEDGQMVRMGTDLDGDGTVDRWDRDAAWAAQRREEEEQEAVDDAPADEDAEADEDAGEDEEES
ncbi:MAG TPA: hypothetical protein RMH99_04400 [Sandaracinaceae bacterium LLY-WYZ-13_1]|nr:hypothetical protein [Sandaracinaceae bacterium LLY-WYZ-13_1]